MTTLDDLVRSRAQERAAAGQRRKQAAAQYGALVEQIQAQAAAEGRSELTPAEWSAFDHARGVRDAARRQVDALDSEVARLRDMQAEEAEYQARAAVNLPVALRTPDPGAGG